MKVYTKGGDKGETSLFGGSRVAKDNPRVMAYGKVDELGSHLGFLKAMLSDAAVITFLDAIQKDLFTLSAELASDERGATKLAVRIGADDVLKLENQIDQWDEILPLLNDWIIPGEDIVSAYAHIARTAARAAERASISLYAGKDTETYVLKYLNRLSDFLFTLARFIAYQAKIAAIKEGVLAKLAKSRYNIFEMADTMIEGSLKKAAEMGIKVNIAIVDNGGNLVSFKRMEDAFLGSVDIAINKAKTAIRFKMTTAVLGALAKPDQPLYGIELSNNQETVIFGGGYPIFDGEKLIGGIGVSGGSVEEDEAVAEAGLKMI